MAKGQKGKKTKGKKRSTTKKEMTVAERRVLLKTGGYIEKQRFLLRMILA